MGAKATPAYQDYYKFVHADSDTIRNEMQRSLGKGATDQQEKAMAALANPIKLLSNAKLAKETWNTVQDFYKDVGKTLFKSQAQLLREHNERMAQEAAQQTVTPTVKPTVPRRTVGTPPKPGTAALFYGYTPEEIQEVATDRKLSVAQVKDMMRRRAEMQ